MAPIRGLTTLRYTRVTPRYIAWSSRRKVEDRLRLHRPSLSRLVPISRPITSPRAIATTAAYLSPAKTPTLLLAWFATRRLVNVLNGSLRALIGLVSFRRG